jgi:hypothetical protein
MASVNVVQILDWHVCRINENKIFVRSDYHMITVPGKDITGFFV